MIISQQGLEITESLKFILGFLYVIQKKIL